MVYSLVTKNYEFLFYGTILIGFWAIILGTEKKMDYPISTLSMLVLWLAFHLFGGTVMIGDTRLYDYILLPIIGEPYNILKFDQMIHVLCYITMTRLIFVPISKVLRDDAPLFFVGLVTILAGSGIGAMNEIVEFAAVVFLDAADAVGGYTNTAIDIVCNTIGASIGWISIYSGLKNKNETTI